MIVDKIFEMEKVYLEKTLNRFREVMDRTRKKIDTIPVMYKSNERLVEKLLTLNYVRLGTIMKSIDRPYFARIDFKDDSENELSKCYIGKVGVVDDENNLITIDWRSPIASIYYDSNIGHASYKAPDGEVLGELLLKRQYEIENRELISYRDVDSVSDDEILKPYLGVSADSRLKNIVSTIQAEQNAIIREDIGKDIIVQGVAGSGKTTVALHRIAYLVYNNQANNL